MSKSRLTQSDPILSKSQPISIERGLRFSPSVPVASSLTPGSISKSLAPIHNSHMLFGSPPSNSIFKDDEGDEPMSPWDAYGEASSHPQAGIFEFEEEDQSNYTERQEREDPQQESYSTKPWF